MQESVTRKESVEKLRTALGSLIIMYGLRILPHGKLRYDIARLFGYEGKEFL